MRCRVSAILVTVAGAALALAATSQAQTKPVAKPTASRSEKTAETSSARKSYGSSTAPITMEVFTDYQCPSCRNLYEQTLKPLINDYVAAGKVYLVHHDFPLQSHMYSGIAARWANAAARVGQFGAVEAALYDNQDSWEASGDVVKYVSAAISPADFRRAEAFVKACTAPAITSRYDRGDPLENDPHPCPLDSAIASDIELGYKVPVQATPTYVITYKGNKLPAGSGVVTWPTLKQFFDSLLSQ